MRNTITHDLSSAKSKDRRSLDVEWSVRFVGLRTMLALTAVREDIFQLCSQKTLQQHSNINGSFNIHSVYCCHHLRSDRRCDACIRLVEALGLETNRWFEGPTRLLSRTERIYGHSQRPERTRNAGRSCLHEIVRPVPPPVLLILFTEVEVLLTNFEQTDIKQLTNSIRSRAYSQEALRQKRSIKASSIFDFDSAPCNIHHTSNVVCIFDLRTFLP